MKRIAGKDAVFLWSETETTHMTIAFLGVFDPSTMPGGPPEPGQVYASFKRLMEAVSYTHLTLPTIYSV